MKQTAVEWLVENSHIVPKNELNKRELIKKAKKIEKQQEQDKKMYSELANLRNELYNQLPTGEVNAFDLIKIINNHIKKLDELI